MAQAPSLTLKGNNTGGTANELDLTVAQVNAILPVFTSALNGLVPASGGGTTNFLRADGTWTTVSATGTPVPTALAVSEWDANVNFSSNSFIPGYRTTVTSSISDTLTVTSPQLEYYTGTQPENVVLPVTSTLVKGQSFTIVNLSSGTFTVESSGGGTLQVMAQNTELIATCILTTGTTAASWSWTYTPLIVAGAFANTALSNLASTAVNVSIVPGVTNSINLGSPTLLWADVYTNTVAAGASQSSISVSGGTLIDASGLKAIDWATRDLYDNAATPVIQLSWSTGGVQLNQTVTANQMVISSSTAALTQLAFGAAGTLLQGNGSTVVPTFSAAPTLGIAGSVQGGIYLSNESGQGAFKVGIFSQVATSSYVFLLPATPGTAGQFLTSQAGSSAMTWTSPTAAPTLTSLGIRSGEVTLGSGVTTTGTVTYSSTLGSTSYSIVATMVNTTDSTPQFQPVTITTQTATTFVAQWNMPTASANYVLHWQAILNN